MDDRIIEVVDYDQNWVTLFNLEAQLLSGVLSEIQLRITHIGSTSIPNMKAKPIIDILIEIEQVSDLDSYHDQLAKAGYLAKGEFGIAGRRFYLKGETVREAHLHCFSFGSEHAIRHVSFRDYLIAHPEIVRDYSELKLRLAKTCNNDIDVYCSGKEPFIQKHGQLALEWQEKRFIQHKS
jgi:GrpB-like predicted nucleotidyltransferase (UPF0157 family)